MLNRLLETDPQLNKQVALATYLFSHKPNDTRLKTHALKRHLKGKFAFSVNDDVRIVFEWMGKNTARFLAIGHHQQVYGKKSG